MGERPKWTMGDFMGQNEAGKKGYMANPVIIYVCKNHNNVVVDVQFQGHETEYEVVQEQFEFELVGGRIFVRPCDADHPQGAAYSDYPRKRPASPRNEPVEISRPVPRKKQEERQARSAKSRSPSRSPSRRDIILKETRYRDQSTSPYTSRKPSYEDPDERYPVSARYPQRGNANRDDINRSAASNRSPRTQPRKIRKESSMWNITTKSGCDNHSIESSASLGDVSSGPIPYCAHQENRGNYPFTERSKNIVRMERGSTNTAVQAGYDEDLFLKRLEQFSKGRSKKEIVQRKKMICTTEPNNDRYNFELNEEPIEEEPRRNVKQYQKGERKQCLLSCHPCCSNEMPPSFLYEEFALFASSETIRREAEKYQEEQDDEEDAKNSNVNKKPEKVKVKPEKEPEEKEVKGYKYRVRESKKAKDKERKEGLKKNDKKKKMDKQKSKSDEPSRSSVVEEYNDHETEEDDRSSKNINNISKRTSPTRKLRKKEDKKEERKSSGESKSNLSPEPEKREEERKEEKETTVRTYRNCCKKCLIYKNQSKCDQ
ncbi:DNA ligase 1 isoform X2 [Halyomorpha halys]|uniref:DNA ligase 1 isoform X2 n=1 Tax=Halyomorpha halys TaxID=286706 RepID=UPI0034D2FCFE